MSRNPARQRAQVVQYSAPDAPVAVLSRKGAKNRPRSFRGLAAFRPDNGCYPEPERPQGFALPDPNSTEVLKYIKRLFWDDLGRLCSINAHGFDPLTTDFRKQEVVAPLELARERFTEVLICI